MMGVRALRLVMCIDVAAALEYKYAVFAVKDPSAAQTFLARYTGAETLHRSDFQISEATEGTELTVTGSRLKYNCTSITSGSCSGNFSDVYFVKPESEQGAMDPVSYGQAVDASHTWAQDDWDWHQEWHLGFKVDDLDAMAARLIADAVPFVTHGAAGRGADWRGFQDSQYNGDGSLFFGIPDTGVTIYVQGKAHIYWTEPYVYCMITEDDTTGRFVPYPMNVTSIEESLSRPMPEFVPIHQAMTSSDSKACAEWATRLLDAKWVHQPAGPFETYQYSDGTCADIRWLEISPGGPQLRFNQMFRKREGHVKVADHEKSVHDLRGDQFHAFDTYMHFRYAYGVDNVSAYRTAFEQANESLFLVDQDRMIVSAPNGYAIELYGPSSLPIDDGSCSLPLIKCQPEVAIAIVTVLSVLVLGCVGYVLWKPIKSAHVAADLQQSLQPRG